MIPLGFPCTTCAELVGQLLLLIFRKTQASNM